MQDVVLRIKAKKELREVSNSFVDDQLSSYLKSNPKQAKKLLQNYHPKSAIFKTVVKAVREKLRRVYGQYRSSDQYKIRDDIIKTAVFNEGNLKLILGTHTSTKERLPIYHKLYQKIFKLTGKPASIIDLGCGLNPFSFRYMELKKIIYQAYDLSEDEVNHLKLYFKHLKQKNKTFSGKVATFNLLEWNRIQKLHQADIAFLFKMTDVLDRGKGHKTSEAVIRDVPAKFVVVSFPTITLSRKKMRYPRRKWIELMCKRLNFSYKYFEYPGEIFYIISK